MEKLPIMDEHFVLRRIPTHYPGYIRPDGTISSQAFSKRKTDDGVSVDVEHLTSPAQAVLHDRRYRLLRLQVHLIRNKINDGLDTIHNPQPENFAHGLITGDVTKGKQKALLNAAEEVKVSL